jgi:hypothetical protein
MAKPAVDEPAEIQARLRNLVNNFNALGFWALMEELTLQQVLEAWLAGQERRAKKEQKWARGHRGTTS